MTINGIDTIEPSAVQEAKGFELEMAGHLSDRWHVVFNGSTSRTVDRSTVWRIRAHRSEAPPT